MSRIAASKGYTLVEILVVIAILAILSFISIPTYVKFANAAKSDICKSKISSINKQINLHLIEFSSLNNLSEVGNFESCCPDGEAFVLVRSDNKDIIPFVQCSGSGNQGSGNSSSGGSNPDDGGSGNDDNGSGNSTDDQPENFFGETLDTSSQQISVLIQNYYDMHGVYPKNNSALVANGKVFAPDEWQNAHPNAQYSIVGNDRLKVLPIPGYEFEYKNTNGTTKKSSSPVWYSMKDKKWYANQGGYIQVETLTSRKK